MNLGLAFNAPLLQDVDSARSAVGAVKEHGKMLVRYTDHRIEEIIVKQAADKRDERAAEPERFGSSSSESTLCSLKA